MNWAHVHIAINHLPVIGSLFTFFLLAFAIARRNEEIKRLSLCIAVLVALATIPVYLTGEPAEEVVEHFPGVSESIIEHHQRSALISLVFAEVLGAVALGGLVFFKGQSRIPGWFILVSLLLAIAVVGSMAWTANLGGQVRHQEARPGF